MTESREGNFENDGAHERQSVQVLERAESILRALQLNHGGLSLGEIAKLIELPRSTVQRIVDALSRESLVIPATSEHGVRLGPALITLGRATRFPIVDLARPTLQSLARKTGETVDLSILSLDRMVFVDQIASKRRLVAVSAVGVTFPLHCSANGKAVMALMSEDELNKFRKRLQLIRYTDNTITSWGTLDKELKTIRKTGLAYDREELTVGISAVAKAARSSNGDFVAFSIPTPTLRFAENKDSLIQTLEHEFAEFKGHFH